ncbi:MAG: RNA polymerase sigma-70 factor [Bacteroidota bacterium]
MPQSNIQHSTLTTLLSINSDESLIASIQQGDYKAFEQLFHRYYMPLCLHAKGLIRCEYRAEEIVSDVFIKVWKNRANIQITTKIRYYLYTGVRNQAVDYLRKQIRERNYQGDLNSDYQSNYHCPHEILIGEEFEARVNEAIASLPPQGKRIFILSRDKGLKYREIAEQLKISIKTVETHMRRSLIHLRACLLD